ncbi:hypothetical protein V5N11_001975 [Cardamine amara subsp. amara]|uniref:CCHC-type domain-containing protein n=1 Tax=Cardamine amara subsp. amara TaxID=228776 RepID=A0ABD1A2A5_CARAN
MYSTCGQLGHKVKRCLQSVTSSQLDVAYVSSSVPSLSLPSSSIEVPTNISILRTNESITIDPTPATTVVEQTIPATVSAIGSVHISATQSFVPADITIIAPIESPLQETAQFSSVTACAQVIVQRESAKQADHNLGSNWFASLDSSEGEEDLPDLDNESGLMDLLIPLGKRILRGRPVKPSAKAKEMQCQATGRGRETEGVGTEVGVASSLHQPNNLSRSKRKIRLYLVHLMYPFLLTTCNILKKKTV